jgi:hypothetical protein
MNFRDNWLPNIVVTIARDLIVGVGVPLILRYWSTVRDALATTVAAAFAAGGGLWRRLRRRDRGTILPLSAVAVNSSFATASLTTSSPELPPGTAAAIAMAMQPPLQPPRFVNNSHWMQWEAYRRQHDETACIAIASTMPGFRAALLSPPSAPTGSW